MIRKVMVFIWLDTCQACCKPCSQEVLTGLTGQVTPPWQSETVQVRTAWLGLFPDQRHCSVALGVLGGHRSHWKRPRSKRLGETSWEDGRAMAECLPFLGLLVFNLSGSWRTWTDLWLSPITFNEVKSNTYIHTIYSECFALCTFWLYPKQSNLIPVICTTVEQFTLQSKGVPIWSKINT